MAIDNAVPIPPLSVSALLFLAIIGAMNSTGSVYQPAGRVPGAPGHVLAERMTGPIKGVTLGLPPGLRRLMHIGKLFASREWSEFPELRIVVTIPTTRLAGLAVTLGATKAVTPCGPNCGHAQFDATPRRAACYWDRHLEDREAWRDDAGIHVGTSTFTKYFDSVHRLPNGFPERNRLPRNTDSHSQAEIKDLARVFGEEPAIAGFRRSAMGAHPVLYIGNGTELRRDIDVASVTAPLDRLHFLGCVAPGEDYDSWFRHPTIVAHEPPYPSRYPWLADVRPRLIIRCGQGALLKPMAGIWDAVPHVVLLSRRSPSSLDAVEAIRAMSWRRISSVMLGKEFKAALMPGEGLEIGCFCEPVGRLMLSEDDDEW